MKLYTYWRSQAGFRVRVAMRLKGLPIEKISFDLLKGHQFDPEYLKLNPMGAVPALIDEEGAPPLVQSLAILEYLDEKYPDPPLLPKDLRARAHARALSQMVAMDAHPLIVPRVRKYLEDELHLDEPTRLRWMHHWLGKASHAVEQTLANDARTGTYCVGEQVTIADLCVVAHFTTIKLFGGGDLTPFPTAARIVENCMKLDAFASEHPMQQPDAPQA
jgi:maleylacetoacetate isomerase